MKRGYRQTRRAEATAETRRRIVDAAIGLHTTVGPARTTISAIAQQAGVERLTVYRHFPREDELFRACVTHGWERFPPPDHRAWSKIADPEQRLRAGLTELYAYYAGVGDGLLVIVHDFPRVPALAALNAPYLAKWDEMRDVLARGWDRRGRRRQALVAAIAHSLDLSTWASLVRRQELPETDAVELLVGMVRCA
ncbi:MAG TPA: TetR family transcriptional regulator [Gaiellaceae bacterium]|nr:TetR family transcriptional regulator [Gaiellaceae bacterium]